MVRTILEIVLCVVLSGPKEPPAAKGKSKPSSKQSISLRDKPWALNIALTGFKITENPFGYNRAQQFVRGENSQKIKLSILITPATEEGDSKAYRERYMAKMRNAWGKAEMTMWESGDLAVAELAMIFEPDPAGSHLWHIYGFFSYDSSWINITLYKSDPTQADKEEMRRILKSAGIGKPVAPSAAKLFFEGEDAFQQGDYEQAAKLYQKALDVQKKNRTFEEVSWRALVAKLGMAYGRSGDWEKCEEVLKYGIKAVPKYPMFHYNMACVYAEKDDLEKAVRYLEKAFKLKKNLYVAEKMPDPREDASFKKYLDREEFKEALKKIGL